MKCPSCSEPIDPAITRAGLSLHPTCDAVDTHPDIIASELFSTIADAIVRQPRSLQKRVGPSEIGTPCDRRLGYRLTGVPEINGTQDVAWKPYVGTAIHEQLANIMATAEMSRFSADEEAVQRWHVEERVTVGSINGVQITGSCDLFDAHNGLVIDWKTTSWNQIREKIRPHGPGAQYEAQAMLYGLGWENAGHSVRNVMLVFLVRDGSFEQRHVWHAPYDRQVAINALGRASSIALALDLLGPEFTLPSLPTADAWCNFCPWHKANATTLSRSCPGHPREQQETPTLAGMLA